MADLNIIVGNLKKIKDAGLPFSEAERYLAREGVSADEVKAFTSSQAQPQQPQGLPLSEKVAGFGAKAAQGATFGLADVLAGAANVGLEKNIVPFMPSVGNLARIISGVPQENKSIGELFKEGRGQFKESAQKVEEKYPRSSVLAELAGGVAMPFGAARGAKTILGTAGQLAKTGAIAGGAYGAGRNVGSVAFDNKSIPQALRETATSAALGGLSGGVLGGAAKTLSSVIPKAGRGIEKIREAIGSKAVAESAANGEPLLMAGEDKIGQLAQTAKLRSPTARDILIKTAEKELSEQPQKITDKVNAVFGEKTPLQNIDDISTTYEKKATPLWEEAMNHGDLGDTLTLNVLTRDPYIKNYVANARRSPLGRGLQNLKDTDINVLQATKELMDDDIAKLFRAGENKQGRALLETKNELVSIIDNAVGKIEKVPPEKSSYAMARKISSDKFSLERAQEKGSDILSNKYSPEEAIKEFGKLETPAEKDAFLVGIRGDLVSRIGSLKNTTRNMAKDIFGESDMYQVRKKLEPILGKDGYGKLINFSDKEIKKTKGLTSLLGGSQTAEKEGLKRPPTDSVGFGVSLYNKILGKTQGKEQQEIARALTDPKFLAEALAKQNKPILNSKLAEALLRAGKRGSGRATGQAASYSIKD